MGVRLHLETESRCILSIMSHILMNNSRTTVAALGRFVAPRSTKLVACQNAIKEK